MFERGFEIGDQVAQHGSTRCGLHVKAGHGVAVRHLRTHGRRDRVGRRLWWRRQRARWHDVVQTRMRDGADSFDEPAPVIDHDVNERRVMQIPVVVFPRRKPKPQHARAGTQRRGGRGRAIRVGR